MVHILGFVGIRLCRNYSTLLCGMEADVETMHKRAQRTWL